MVLPFIATAPATPAEAPTIEVTASQHATAESGTRHHTVRTGETVHDIAERYRVSTVALLTRNSISAGDFIHPGQQLRIPPREAATQQTSTKRPSRSGSTRSYLVRTGDTLGGIAARHGMSVERLRSLNDLDRGHIVAGDKLRVSGTSSKPAKRSTERPSATSTHTVRSGENLTGIAKRHDMSPTRLAKLNRLSPGDVIRPGDKLKVSDSRSASESSRSSRRSGGATTASETSSTAKAATRNASTGATYDHNSFAGHTYSDKIVSAAADNRRTLAQRDLPSRQQVHDKIVRTAKRHGVDPALALAISYQESGWSQRKVSVANAIGTMQVIPSSGEWVSGVAGRDLDLLETDDNITAGVLLIKILTDEASTTSEAIAGYYQGLASVEKHGMYEDTKQYVANVHTLRQRM